VRLTVERGLHQRIVSTRLIHIFGAGLNSEKPAHKAVHELSARGWAVAPIHPRDAGATINGFPIRPSLDKGISPEIVVLFLSPERARSVVRNLIINQDAHNFPLVWFQHGAEDEDAISALEEMGANYVIDDCIVVNSNTNDLHCDDSILPQTWCLQTASEDGDGCSVWTVHSSDSGTEVRITSELEWVGSLDDLSKSEQTIPRYIRSLKQNNESLLDLANRLAN
jgi:predicted CoA-binding protein